MMATIVLRLEVVSLKLTKTHCQKYIPRQCLLRIALLLCAYKDHCYGINKKVSSPWVSTMKETLLYYHEHLYRK